MKSLIKFNEQEKQLIKESYIFGVQNYKNHNCAPYLNIEFMKIVPNCDFGDSKGCKLRTKMFSAYINGWTSENLNQK